MIPKDLQNEVYHQFRTNKGKSEHVAAVRRCYDAIHEKRGDAAMWEDERLRVTRHDSEVQCNCGNHTAIRWSVSSDRWVADDPTWLHDGERLWHCSKGHCQARLRIIRKDDGEWNAEADEAGRQHQENSN